MVVGQHSRWLLRGIRCLGEVRRSLLVAVGCLAILSLNSSKMLSVETPAAVMFSVSPSNSSSSRSQLSALPLLVSAAAAVSSAAKATQANKTLERSGQAAEASELPLKMLSVARTDSNLRPKQILSSEVADLDSSAVRHSRTLVAPGCSGTLSLSRTLSVSNPRLTLGLCSAEPRNRRFSPKAVVCLARPTPAPVSSAANHSQLVRRQVEARASSDNKRIQAAASACSNSSSNKT